MSSYFSKLFVACARHRASCLPQGTLHGIDANFTSTNPLGDPTLTTIADLTLQDLVHVVYLTGKQSQLLILKLPTLMLHFGLGRWNRRQLAALTVPALANMQSAVCWCRSIEPCYTWRRTVRDLALLPPGAYDDGVPDFLTPDAATAEQTPSDVHSSSNNTVLKVQWRHAIPCSHGRAR